MIDNFLDLGCRFLTKRRISRIGVPPLGIGRKRSPFGIRFKGQNSAPDVPFLMWTPGMIILQPGTPNAIQMVKAQTDEMIETLRFKGSDVDFHKKAFARGARAGSEDTVSPYSSRNPWTGP
jgi:hypothetical protein